MRVLGGLWPVCGVLGGSEEGLGRPWSAQTRPKTNSGRISPQVPPRLGPLGKSFSAILGILFHLLGTAFWHMLFHRSQTRFCSDFGPKIEVKMGPKTDIFDAVFPMSI